MFQKRRTLLSAWEAVKYSPVTRDYPLDVLCEHINSKEKFVLLKCFSSEFYKALINDLINYDSELITEYNQDLTYQVGDLVMFDTVILKSLIANNIDSVYDDTSWEVAKKFTTQANNDLWEEGYLREYLSYMMIYSSVTYVTNPAGGKGVVTYWVSDMGVTHTPEKSLYNFKGNLRDDANDILAMMKLYLKENAISFSGWNTGCGGNKCSLNRHTRINYRR